MPNSSVALFRNRKIKKETHGLCRILDIENNYHVKCYALKQKGVYFASMFALDVAITYRRGVDCCLCSYHP